MNNPNSSEKPTTDSQELKSGSEGKANLLQSSTPQNLSKRSDEKPFSFDSGGVQDTSDKEVIETTGNNFEGGDDLNISSKSV